MSGTRLSATAPKAHENHMKFQARLRKYYPDWPWVEVGSVFNNPLGHHRMPNASDGEQLRRLIDDGRSKWQVVLESDEKDLPRRLMELGLDAPDEKLRY